MQLINKKYLEQADIACVKIRDRVLKRSIKTGDRYVAWGQHIDEQITSQVGIYGTTGAIEIIDIIDTDKNPSQPLPEEITQAISYLKYLFENEEALISSEDSSGYQLKLLPKLSSLLSCLSHRITNLDNNAKKIREYVVDRIRKSQSMEDGGWPVYYETAKGEIGHKKPSSDILVTAKVLTAAVKAKALSEIQYQKAIEFLKNSLKTKELPLHVRLFSLFAIRSAEPENIDDLIRKHSKKLVRDFDKAFPNILEVYCPFDVTDLSGRTGTTAHYFVVKPYYCFKLLYDLSLPVAAKVV
jgi:hypothetical protein